MNDEEIQPIQGPIEIERVIDGNEVKTYECNGTLLILDDTSPGQRYEGCEVFFINPVPVYSDDDTLIGHCTISVTGKRVDGQFFLDYHTPERLEIEQGIVKLYPDIEALEAIDTSHPPWRVAHCNICRIVLSAALPHDKRLDPL